MKIKTGVRPGVSTNNDMPPIYVPVRGDSGGPLN